MTRQRVLLEQFFRDKAALQTVWRQVSSHTSWQEQSQQLFDEITTRSPLRASTPGAATVTSPSSSAPDELTTDNMWAFVAVGATLIRHDLVRQQQPPAEDDHHEPTPPQQPRRKRRKRSVAEDSSKQEEPEPEEAANVSATLNVVQYLCSVNMKMSTFLNCLSSLFDRLLLTPESLSIVKQIKEDFTVASVLYEKYQTLWRLTAQQQGGAAAQPKVVKTNTRKSAKSREESQRQQHLFNVGWLLFVIAKHRLHDKFTGLGDLYLLLLAVLHLVVSKLDLASVEAEVAAALSSMGSSSSSAAKPSALRKGLMNQLCSQPKVDQQQVEHAAVALEHMIEQLTSEQVVLAQESALGSLTTIFNSTVLADNVAKLTSHYQACYLPGFGNLDERLYLNESTRQVLIGSVTSTTSPRMQPELRVRRVTMTDQSGVNGFLSELDASEHHAITDREGAKKASEHTGSKSSVVAAQAWQWMHESSPPPSHPRRSGHTVVTTPRSRMLNTPLRTASNRQRSPLVTQTPVTAALETNKWMRETLASRITSSPQALSPKLEEFFRACSKNPADTIASTLEKLSQRLFASRKRKRLGWKSKGEPTALGTLQFEADDQDAGDEELSEVDGSLKKAQQLSVVLFYLVLESLLVAEQQRLHCSNFYFLLSNETFVSSLFACCLEVILKAHSLITFSFPFLLETVEVSAFDFGKLMESFVKHVPELPVVLKRHMRDLEQSILENLVWKSNSGLYSVLSSEKNTQKAHATAHANALQLFFRKVLALVASRILYFGNALKLEVKYLNQIWTAMKECLSTHHEKLLRDRHLDQILLCCVYGVCKVNHLKPEMTFKRILEVYKQLSRSFALRFGSEDVIRNIRLDESGSSKGDIIKFYNRCFIPTMKAFLLQFQIQEKQLMAAEAAIQREAGVAVDGENGKTSGTNNGDAVVTGVSNTTSDIEIVAEAAADTVEKMMQSYGPREREKGMVLERDAPASSECDELRTPPRRKHLCTTLLRTPPLTGSSASPFVTSPLFTEVQTLPVSVQHTSPKRVLSSNIYMSPLRQSRLHRSQMTPRTHALYAFGESPSQDLALINRAVNSHKAPTRNHRLSSVP